MSSKYVKLLQPPLLDFSTLQEKDDVRIVICNTEHKFATDAEFSGTDIIKQPIFGSRVYINGKKFAKSSFGLPFIRFPQGTTPKITYENKTQFTFNIHYHGLNTVGSIDGTSMEVVFGHNTLLGPKVVFQFPQITNNQALLWFHSHNMFVSMELIYGGAVGLLQITDKSTEWLSESFEYGNNQLLLTALDMDLTKNGTQTSANLIAFSNRSNFSVINGTSAVNWYSSDPSVSFVNRLYHISTKNLVKIDILNASLNSRVYHLGICDKNWKIKSFHLVQNDCGLVNPRELKMVSVPVAGRVGIIIDLDDYKDQIAYVFFYDYDLTEIFGSVPTFPDQPNNQTITGTIPDLDKSNNTTPYPTPIPDPEQQNQQKDYSNLDYPPVRLIEQTNQVLENGGVKVPRKSEIKPFLKIILKGDEKLSLDGYISQIRKTIFGCDTYKELKCILKQPCFEYEPKFNYLSFLNENYYFNLPDFKADVPTRNICLFGEDNTNAIAGGNVNGTTEYVNSTIRMMVDLWNSAELNLEWAFQQYEKSPNNYKPSTLPTSKFRIYKTNDTYSNTAMISNDTLIIQLFTSAIHYGDFSSIPIASVTIVFPETPPLCHSLNLQEWIDLVNDTFSQTTIDISGEETNLGTILKCDWSFFPYAITMLYQKTVYIKSAVVKTINNSAYYIRLLGRWPLLQFFGKPMAGNTLNLPSSSNSIPDLMSRLQAKRQKNWDKIRNNLKKIIMLGHKQKQTINSASILPPKKNSSQYMKCDEIGTYGTYDAEIQQIFPFYATNDGNVQLPIACMKRNAELIIGPKETYIGLYDGYLNDNLNSFSVRLKSSEIWIYTNGDDADSHPLHFHLTSGFASPQSNLNSSGLVDCKRFNDPLIYSRDIYQIGPQQSVSFYLTWPYYASSDKTKTPTVRCVGGVIHCHYLQHNDANSMIIQYFVDPEVENEYENPKEINNQNQKTSGEIKKLCCEHSSKN